MRISFEDDEPVELDCGCICSDGIYSVSSCDILNRDKTRVSGAPVMDFVKLSYCYDSEECFYKAVESKLNFKKYFSYMEEYVKTAYEKELECGDMEGE